MTGFDCVERPTRIVEIVRLTRRRFTLAGKLLNFIAASLIACCATLLAPASAQTLFEQSYSGIQDPDDSDIGFRRGSFVVAPIPFNSPVVGSGLALGGAYLFKNPGARTSTLGLGGFKTDNGSEGYGLGGKVEFDEGRWTVQAGVASAYLNYDLTLNGVTSSIRQTGEVFRLGAEYSPASNLSFATALSYLESQIDLRGVANQPLPPDLQIDSNIALARLEFSPIWDTRDDTFYPTKGVLASLTMSLGTQVSEFFGNSRNTGSLNYGKLLGSAAGYYPVGKEGVVTGRLVMCGASDQTPFFDLCGLGYSDAMRGFPATSFLDQSSASIQVEYRGRINRTFGYVVFAGTGGIGDDLGEAVSNGQGFAGGAGLRIRLSKKFKLDYAIDAAVHESGNDFLYLSVGQRF